ncbi:MAG: CHASE4 domain-containing protein, partial [Methanosarcina sp.]
MSAIDISKKVLIITLLIFAILTTAFTFTHNMQLSNFLELEQADTLKNVQRVQNVISTEQGYLDYINEDWACWDDTCKFIKDGNQKFINTNAQNETLSSLRINVMIFVNNSGSVVYSKAIDANTGEEEAVSKELIKLVENGTLLTKTKEDRISGFILLDKDPMFISCHPILTTKYQGPSRGTLIFGRYLDSALFGSFEKLTRSSLTMHRVDRDMPPDFQAKFNNFPDISNKVVIEPLSEEQIAGYFEFKDISDNPALIMRADFPRDLYMHGKKTLN